MERFAQALIKCLLDERNDFRPSTSLNVNGRVRWLNPSRVTPELQVNARFEGREHGGQANHDNGESTVISVSP